MSRAAAPASAEAPPTRRQRMVAPALTFGTLAAATLALHVRDPHVRGSWGICPTAALGFACPGCGGLRAVNDLTHLDLAGAASSNLAFVLLLPFAVAGLLLWTADRWRGRRREVPQRVLQPAIYAVCALLAGFMVLRNLPWFAWLAP